jgi:hypothetical protein
LADRIVLVSLLNRATKDHDLMTLGYLLALGQFTSFASGTYNEKFHSPTFVIPRASQKNNHGFFRVNSSIGCGASRLWQKMFFKYVTGSIRQLHHPLLWDFHL